MPALPLTDDQISAALTELPGWQVRDQELTATYQAARERIPALYTSVARAEDAANHHARITVLYGTITFAMNTDDAGGAITGKDTALAARIASLATEHGASLAR